MFNSFVKKCILEFYIHSQRLGCLLIVSPTGRGYLHKKRLSIGSFYSSLRGDLFSYGAAPVVVVQRKVTFKDVFLSSSTKRHWLPA